MPKTEIVRARVEPNIRAAMEELSRQRLSELSDTARQALAAYIETTIADLEATAKGLGDSPRAGDLQRQADQLRTAYTSAQDS